jgi:hypothetical protein
MGEAETFTHGGCGNFQQHTRQSMSATECPHPTNGKKVLGFELINITKKYNINKIINKNNNNNIIIHINNNNISNIK